VSIVDFNNSLNSFLTIITLNRDHTHKEEKQDHGNTLFPLTFFNFSACSTLSPHQDVQVHQETGMYSSKD